MELSVHGVCTMRMRVICRKNGRQYVWPSKGGSAQSQQRVSMKTQQIFLLSLPAEYVAAFSERTDTPEVRCDLTDRQTHTHSHTHTHTGQYHIKQLKVKSIN